MHKLERIFRNRDLMIRFMEGESVEDLATRYDLSETTVVGVLSSPMIQEEMRKLAELAGVPERIVNLSMQALDTIRDTMQGKSTSELRFKAAKDLLDRNPDARGDKQTNEGKFAQGLGESIIAAICKKQMEKAPEAATAKGEGGDAKVSDISS